MPSESPREALERYREKQIEPTFFTALPAEPEDSYKPTSRGVAYVAVGVGARGAILLETDNDALAESVNDCGPLIDDAGLEEPPDEGIWKAMTKINVYRSWEGEVDVTFDVVGEWEMVESYPEPNCALSPFVNEEADAGACEGMVRERDEEGTWACDGHAGRVATRWSASCSGGRAAAARCGTTFVRTDSSAARKSGSVPKLTTCAECVRPSMPCGVCHACGRRWGDCAEEPPMPDPNKHAALAAHGFKIAKVCATCVHWSPTGATGHGWGKCSLIRYSHTKHTEEDRPTGVPEYGSCDKHGLDLRSLTIAVGEDYAARYAEDDDG